MSVMHDSQCGVKLWQKKDRRQARLVAAPTVEWFGVLDSWIAQCALSLCDDKVSVDTDQLHRIYDAPPPRGEALDRVISPGLCVMRTTPNGQ
jgi:hypothetical protein